MVAPAKSKEEDETEKEGDKVLYSMMKDETTRAAIDDGRPMPGLETRALYQWDRPSASGLLHADSHQRVEETGDESLYEGET